MQFSSIWPTDRTLSGATSEPGSNGNEDVLCNPESSSITETSPSDDLVSYPGHSLGGSYPSAEVHPVYSTAPADWAIVLLLLSEEMDTVTRIQILDEAVFLFT